MAHLRSVLATRAGRVVIGLLAIVVVVTAVGMIVLWPRDRPSGELLGPPPESIETAEVVELRSVPCPAQVPSDCEEATIELKSGPDTGKEGAIQLGSVESDPDLEVGNRLRVAKNVAPEQVAPGQVQPPTGGAPSYSLIDFDRRAPLLWLALAFVALVLAVARWRGAASLVGMGLSVLVVVAFIVPAIVDGRSPLAVAIVGALAVMLATIVLTHGLGVKSLAAMLGTTASLVLTALLAVLFVGLANITGLSSEEAVILHANDPGISIEGLVLAGTVIAALGVLDDVTISQASVVLALQRADPRQRFRQLFARALSVGRDHVAATVNTLILAYVGVSLPILLVFSTRGTSLTDAVSSEAVAESIVGTLVGSIGLVAAVPFTTALAATLAARIPPEELSAEAGQAH